MPVFFLFGWLVVGCCYRICSRPIPFDVNHARPNKYQGGSTGLSDFKQSLSFDRCTAWDGRLCSAFFWKITWRSCKYLVVFRGMQSKQCLDTCRYLTYKVCQLFGRDVGTLRLALLGEGAYSAVYKVPLELLDRQRSSERSMF